MSITDLSGLYVGYNKEEDFRVLICALDKIEAHKIADEYRNDSHLSGSFDISEFDSVDLKFDCDYVLTYSPS